MDLTNAKDILLFIAIIIIGIHAIFLYFKLFDSSLIYLRHGRIYLLIFYIELFIILFYLYSHIFHSNTSHTDSADISDRIEGISDDLSKASSELSTIQKELEARIEFVENLKSEAEIAENMLSLSEEQVNAVQAKLNQELNANSGKSLLQTILVSLFFFLLGLIVQPITRAIKNRFTKTIRDDTAAAQTDRYSDEQLEQAVKLLDAIKHQRDTE